MRSCGLFLGVSLVFACSSPIPPLGDEASGSSGAGESSSEGTGSVDPTEQGGSQGEATTDGADLGCDPYAQDCPAGEKCTHYNSMGAHDSVDATMCVPIPPAPRQTGEVCTATGGFGAGDDDCGEGDFCYFLGGDDVGVCVPLCAGSAEQPLCDAGTHCARGVGQALYLCLGACDPLAQDCLEGANCNPTDEGFVCALDNSGEGGQIYDACGFANGCDPGLMCAAPGSAPGCPAGAEGCCLPLCYVGGTTCPESLECVSLYDTPELEVYGACVAPEGAGAAHAASLAASTVNSGPAAR